MNVPGSVSTGRSFQEWTAKSPLPDIRSFFISLVNTPISGILFKGVVKSLSPRVDLKISSTSKSGNLCFSSADTKWAWILAKSLFLEINLIVFKILRF